MEPLIDTSTEFGSRVERRLREDIVAWLTTVARDGTPQPNAVWFLWDGGSILIYSIPGQAKIKNIGRNPRVAFNLDSAKGGDDVVVITGTAVLDAAAPAADRNTAYIDKYRERIMGLGLWPPEKMAAQYSTAIRITPTRVRGY